LRGYLRSRPLNDIVTEAKHLIASGVREIVLVAQETTAYGHDLDPSVGLGVLLEQIALISKDVWIRVLYGHPQSIDIAAIDAVARHSNICAYFDLPIQHADDRLLQKMGRHYTRDDLYRLFDTIRTRVPQAVLRTTFIVGFPGETEQAFKDLMQFAKDVRFDNLGVFTYSDSEDLVSHKLADHVPIKITKQRYDALMACQKNISLENNTRHIGRTYDVLVDEAPEDHLFIGRTCFQAPEVDGTTYVQADGLNVGEFVHVKITDALEYDLSGEPV
jgi:ribosomal protein S12 methylthiotransferase